MKFKFPIDGRTIASIIMAVSAFLVLSAIIPMQMTTSLSANVTQPAVTSAPFNSISLILGIPGFIIGLLGLAGYLEWKAKYWKSRTPVVAR